MTTTRDVNERLVNRDVTICMNGDRTVIAVGGAPDKVACNLQFICRTKLKISDSYLSPKWCLTRKARLSGSGMGGGGESVVASRWCWVLGAGAARTSGAALSPLMSGVASDELRRQLTSCSITAPPRRAPKGCDASH